MKVSAVVVTRGNVDLAPVLNALPFDEVIVWNNAERKMVDGRDAMVYGRWLAAWHTKHPCVYTLDDDVIPENPAEILEHYEPGTVTCNMTPGHVEAYTPMKLGLVGFGAIFDRSLIHKPFARYVDKYPMDEIFLRECDRVFTRLNKLKYVTLPFQHREHASLPGQMWREARHGDDLKEIRRRLEAL